jgi:RNA polymerase sigma-70 factor (ECF subfamily)
VGRCRQEDLEAFDALIQRYQKRIFSLCFHQLNHYEDACDLAQEVFVQVYRSLGQFRGQSSFSTWIYRVALNACTNRRKFLRAKGRDKATSLDQILERRGEGPLKQPGQKDALGELESRETLQQVRAALDSLDEEFHQVIHLVDLEGMEYRQAAAVLGVPVNTVRSRLSRARSALKGKLELAYLREGRGRA